MTATDEREWVPFSTRYGIARDDRFADHEGHNRHTTDAPTAPDRERCDCLGTSRLRCAAYMDNEDLLCAECRAWCWGVTGLGPASSAAPPDGYGALLFIGFYFGWDVTL